MCERSCLTWWPSSSFSISSSRRSRAKDWEKPTPAKGWSIRDTISHLADSAELAGDALNGGDGIETYRTAPNLDALRQEAVKKGRKMRYQDVIEWWRGGRAKVVEPLSHMDADKRIEWIAGSMSALGLSPRCE